VAIQTDEGRGQSEGSRQAESTADVLPSWIPIVRGEFLEIPGLCLTRSQVQRLWGLDGVLCDRILEALISVRFLQRTPNGAFVRADQDGR
jgi:hypothetical protein